MNLFFVCVINGNQIEVKLHTIPATLDNGMEEIWGFPPVLVKQIYWTVKASLGGSVERARQQCLIVPSATECKKFKRFWLQ